MKKVKGFFIFLAIAFCISFMLTACGGNGNNTQYTVNFDCLGGSYVDSQTITSGGYLTVPENPAKDNYYFDGWYVSTETDAELWDFDDDTVTENMTLYAKWLSYITVTFDSHNGEEAQLQAVPEGKFAARPVTPERTGYNFLGWFKGESENAERWDFESDKVTSAIILHAHWQAQIILPSTDLMFIDNGNGYTVTGVTGSDTSIEIPAIYNGQPVTVIGESAFAYSSHNELITSISIPDSVTRIETNAFYNRSDLISVDIGENSMLTEVGGSAFSGCVSLESIYIPSRVTSLGDSFLNNCGSLNTITVAEGNTVYSGEGNSLIEIATHTLIRGSNTSVIPEDVTMIAQEAFSNAALISLTIPASVTFIGNYIIRDSAVTSIVYNGTMSEWERVEKDTFWNMGKTDVEVVFSVSTPTYEVEAPGEGPASASRITSVGGVPMVILNNGIQMPRFGLGTQIQRLENGDLGILNNTSRGAVEAALRAGYRHLDTAHGYRNERGVGQGIIDSGVSREEIWLTSKLWPNEYGDAYNAITSMLDRLQVEYLDLVYLHHPAGTIATIESAWRGLERAYREGKIRALGISNFDNRMEAFNAIMDEEIKPQVMQIECHPFAQRQETRALAEQYNIQVECWYPLGHADERLLNSNVLETIATAHNKSVVQIIIRWHMQEGFSAIPGSTNPAHIQENIDIFDFELTDEEMEQIRTLDGTRRYFNISYGNNLGAFGAAQPEWNGTFD